LWCWVWLRRAYRALFFFSPVSFCSSVSPSGARGSGEMLDKVSSPSWISRAYGIGIWGGWSAMKTSLECLGAECVLDSAVIVLSRISVEPWPSSVGTVLPSW
jgi:hypothetical protein